jgi:uncharacterized protein involved in exopolysaccharide biosynthesis/Mrp family chromosome partitioning ATPase
MNSHQPSLSSAHQSVSIDDILYVIFRHKWKIIACTTIGLIGAVTVFFLHPPPFQSEAMLLIRYVTETSTPGVPGNDSKAVSPDQRGENIMNTEVEILNSWDIAQQVADAIGPDKILSKQEDPKNRNRAAISIQENLIVEPVPKSNVIRIIYLNKDATVVQPVLAAVVEAYLKKHVEVHRGIGAVGDFLSQETDQLRTRLSQTEDDLRKAKSKAGIISIDDSKKGYSEQMARIQQDIYSAEADLAERSAVLNELSKRNPAALPTTGSPTEAAEAAIPSETIDNYQNLQSRLDSLQTGIQQLLGQFTEQNQRVIDMRAAIAAVQDQKQKLESKYPGLLRLEARRPSQSGSKDTYQATPSINSVDLEAESARLSGLQSKIKVLNSELEQIRINAGNAEQVEATISDLQRQKELEEANYKYYSTHLEATRIDETLGAGKALNIAEIQAPTPPSNDWLKTYKALGMIAGGGIMTGLIWAFLIEFYLDHSIRRPVDIERALRIPLFLSVPKFDKDHNNSHVFHETLRDRLIGYFESRNLTHKPKLLAVTGVTRKSGVTTTAAGLAQCLSETGDGNVLLVDMTQSQGSAQQYYKGKAVVGLDQMLDTRTTAQMGEKLFVVGQEPNSDKLSRALPARFNRLVPQLKASDFYYVIFDMPTVNQISITPRLAGFMDMVLLVVESEKTDREIARQAAELLASSRAPVGVVLNKSRNYLPSKVQHDFLGSS